MAARSGGGNAHDRAVARAASTNGFDEPPPSTEPSPPKREPFKHPLWVGVVVPILLAALTLAPKVEVVRAILLALAWVFSAYVLFKEFSKPKAVGLALAVAILLGGLCWWERTPIPLAVTQASLINSDAGMGSALWYPFMGQEGNCMAPIHVLEYIRVKNTSPYPIFITSIRAELKTSMGWKDMSRIPLWSHVILFGDAPQKMTEITLEDLDTATQKPIEAARTIGGWVAFEYPHVGDFDPRNTSVRIIVSDDSGDVLSAPFATGHYVRGYEDLSDQTMRIGAKNLDFSSYYRKFYSDSPKQQ